MDAFNRLESEVRSYCRAFPTVFTRATGSTLIDESGTEYVDFFSGAGTLNYGHNNPLLRQSLVEYLLNEGVVHSLDMATVAKRDFLETFDRLILAPRELRYKVQFPGPTGTNAVEAALKLARKVMKRSNVIFFHNAYHGMTLGALAVTGNSSKRRGAGVPLHNAIPAPFGEGPEVPSSIAFLESVLTNSSSGVDLPAAVIVETVQAEGGVNVASTAWLRDLEALVRRYDILLIVDDIQVGCGRTGTFFSFEEAGIEPDIVCLSKSISGFGLPMSLVLLKPELDVWAPGEHNGTFRGHNLAFVTGAKALATYWEDDRLSREVFRKAGRVCARLEAITERYPEVTGQARGRGLIQGLPLMVDSLATEVAAIAFRRGLVIECVGSRDQVFKILPPLVIEDAEIEKGMDILERSLEEALSTSTARLSPQMLTI